MPRRYAPMASGIQPECRSASVRNERSAWPKSPLGIDQQQRLYLCPVACTLRATWMPLTTNSRCRSPKGRPPPRCIAPFAMSSTKPCGDLYGNSDVLRARRPRPTHTDRTFESAVYLRHICGQSEPILTAKPARALKVRPGLWPNTRAFRKGPCSPRLPPLCSAASARSALSGSNPSFSAVKSLPRRAAQPSTLARHKKIHLKKKEFSF
jgi:hypothetical protein